VKNLRYTKSGFTTPVIVEEGRGGEGGEGKKVVSSFIKRVMNGD
jgi:hypothetical protein